MGDGKRKAVLRNSITDNENKPSYFICLKYFVLT